MAKRKRRLILDNVHATLLTIKSTAGYSRTPTVERVLRTWHDAQQKSTLPWLGFAPLKMPPPQPQPFGCYRVTLPIQVAVHATAATHDDAHEVVDELLDDVLGALNEDPSRCGYAIDTLWRGNDTTDGDDSIFDRGGIGIATGVSLWDVIYERDSKRSS